MAIAVQPFEGTYELDRDHSSFQLAVKHLDLSTFRASFADIGRLLSGAAPGACPRRPADLRGRAGLTRPFARPRLTLATTLASSEAVRGRFRAGVSKTVSNRPLCCLTGEM